MVFQKKQNLIRLLTIRRELLFFNSRLIKAQGFFQLQGLYYLVINQLQNCSKLDFFPLLLQIGLFWKKLAIGSYQFAFLKPGAN
jgi:hypothetical protein